MISYRDILAANIFGQEDMSGQLAVDNTQASWFARHAPSTGLMDHRVPNKVSDHPMIPHPVISTINNMFEYTDELCKPYGGD